MARFETITYNLECHDCGRSGKVTWEEFENPMHHKGRIDSRLISITEGFKEIDEKIICADCGKIVNPKQDTTRRPGLRYFHGWFHRPQAPHQAWI